MLLIAVSWLYIFLASTLVGLFIQQQLKLPFQALIIQFLGWFGIGVFATCFAFLFPLNGIFHGILFSILLILGFTYQKKFIQLHKHLWKVFKNLKIGFKAFIVLVTVLILAECASAPYILDNESYYLQTIKWLNEYGLVNGLGNLHLYLGQTSGWHILQAAFNFNFLYDSFNDLSGYCLLWGNLYAVKLLNDYFKRSPQRVVLFFAALPLTNVLFFSFIAAPSPDIPVYIISWYIFYIVFKDYKNTNTSHLLTISLFIFFLIFIKFTNAFLLILPLYFFILKFNQHKKTILSFSVFGFFTLVIIVLKNSIVTGIPLYPTPLFSSFIKLDYQLPIELQEFYYHYTKAFAFKLSPTEYEKLNIWQLFSHWLTLPKLHGFFNKLIIIIFLLFPFFIQKIAHKKNSVFLYIIGIIQLLILGVTSPQYRFFLNILFLIIALLSTYFLQNKKLISGLLMIISISLIIQTFFSFSLNKFTNNPYASQSSGFQLTQVLYPHQNSRYSFEYEIKSVESLEYFSPLENDFFWNTGNGPLPTVNKDQIEYFKKGFHYIPQRRGKSIKDGFFSKKIKSE